VFVGVEILLDIIGNFVVVKLNVKAASSPAFLLICKIESLKLRFFQFASQTIELTIDDYAPSTRAGFL
jgi:hypothetical protein